MEKERRKRMPVYIRITIIFLVVAMVGILSAMLFAPVFRVEEVLCDGLQRISQEEIVAAAEVPTGQSILLQRLSGIKDKVLQMPMVEEAKVRRVFPNKIKITIQERVPAAYIYDGEKSCAVVDMDGEILEIIEGNQVAKMKAYYTPVVVEKETEKEDKKTEKKNKAEEEGAEPKTEDGEASNEEAMETIEAEQPVKMQEPKRAYPVPFVVGLKLEKPEAGKKMDSKERDKLTKVKETFHALEKTGLLVRTTYMDVTDMSDLILMVENRLEIYMGEFRNMEYRCKFLDTVIREKISSTEHVIMDYRGNDIYVRLPEDGKERMIPKPKEEPEEDSAENKGEDSEQGDENTEKTESETRQEDSDEETEESSM